MKKYVKPMMLSFQSVFQYRFNIVLYMVFGLIPLVALILLWHSLFESQEKIQGYTLEMMITYVIIAKLIEIVLLPEMHWSISEEIQSGDLSKYLTKPISYSGYWFSQNLGNKLVQVLMASIPLIPIIYLNRDYFLLPQGKYVGLFLISLIGALILYFTIYFLISLFSFYFVEISAFFFTVDIVLELFAGSLIPLEFLPEPLATLTQLLPFAYLIHFPVNIYLGNMMVNEIIVGIIIQLSWSVFFLLIISFCWKRGLNKYESVGA
ncbi:ABC transporter permease [Metabacillus idriensis]|uniref:ABC transporter permease n=1 Tax=Metabacillus idriensis TaxID=324768 RepID=UPI00174BE2E1|nr:ABC-2 family transporter protein [Metabacillus idriensis]